LHSEFYKLVLAGKTEEKFELHEWFGLYKIWLKRREHYFELLNLPALIQEIEKLLVTS